MHACAASRVTVTVLNRVGGAHGVARTARRGLNACDWSSLTWKLPASSTTTRGMQRCVRTTTGARTVPRCDGAMVNPAVHVRLVGDQRTSVPVFGGQAWEREKAEELERAKRVFAEAHARAAEEALRMSQVEQHEAARRQLHGELLRLREAKVRAATLCGTAAVA